MEMRIMRCMKSQGLGHLTHGDLFSFLRCHVERESPRGQCFDTMIIKKNTFTYGNASRFGNEFRNCPTLGTKRLRISLHKMFTVNLTFSYFVIKNKKDMQPYHGNCRGFRYYLTVYHSNTSTIYCGKQYPWSIFISTHTVEFKLPTNYQKGISAGTIMAQVEVMDSHFAWYQWGAYMGGIVTWGDFNIQTYLISVQMFYRLRLTVDPFQHASVIIYDGPRAVMPKLSEHTFANHSAIYFPSTFQVFVVYTIKRGIPTFKIIYKSTRQNTANILMPSHYAYLKNNSGCGDDYIQSWICPFKIVTSAGAQVRLRISLLDITGPFSNAFESAGIAIYNVFNNTVTLVGHMYGNIGPQDNVTFIGTENQLLVSVYSYAPFTLLSCILIVESSPCAGVFLGKVVRPSISLTKYHANASIPMIGPTESKTIFMRGLSIDMNTTSKCLVVHIIFLPYEYLHRTWYMDVQLDSNFVKIDTHIVGKHSGRMHIEGDYAYIRGERRSRSHEVVGNVARIFLQLFSSKGNRIMYTMNIVKTSCLHACRNSHTEVTIIETKIPQCDLCDYHWFYKRRTEMGHYTIPNRTVSFCRVVGDHPLSITLSSVLELQSGGHLISYALREIDINFKHKRFMRIDLEEGGMWRTRKADLSPPIYNAYNRPGHGGLGLARPISLKEFVMDMGIYEYIVLPEYNHRTMWDLFDLRCRNKGANVLMIDDIPELRFVIENIMLPLELERVPIARTSQVCPKSSAFNTLRPRQNAQYFPYDIFKCIFVNENAWALISLKFVPKGSYGLAPTRRLVHWCLYASLSPNELKHPVELELDSMPWNQI